MKTLLCLKNPIQGLPAGIKRKIFFGKYEDKDYGICDGSATDFTDEDDEDQHYSRKKSKFDPWQVFVGGAHRYLQDTFSEGVQHTVGKHPDMDTDEAEEVTFDKLEPRYRAEVIDRYQRFLKVSKAMKKDPLHKKITDTAKRLRDEDEIDEDDALRYAFIRIKNEDTSWMGNLKNLTHQPIP